LAVRFFRKGSEHLIPNGTVGDTPAPRGNAALRSQALPKVLVIGFHPHPPAAHRGERLVPPHPAIPAERASRTQALDGLAAPAKSVAAHSPQSATSTKDCLERRNSIRPCVPSMAPGHSTVMRLLPHPPSSGHDPKILGLQSSHGSPYRRDCQHYGYLSGCAG